MAKRGRMPSVDKLLARLKALDTERTSIMAGIRAAVAHVVDAEAPVVRKYQKKTAAIASGVADAASALVADVKAKRTMSPEGRAAIAAAQKRRWAKIRKAAAK